MQPRSLPTYRYTSTSCYFANSYIGISLHLLLGQNTYKDARSTKHKRIWFLLSLRCCLAFWEVIRSRALTSIKPLEISTWNFDSCRLDQNSHKWPFSSSVFTHYGPKEVLLNHDFTEYSRRKFLNFLYDSSIDSVGKVLCCNADRSTGTCGLLRNLTQFHWIHVYTSESAGIWRKHGQL